MTSEAVRSLIREVLAEELGRIARERAPTPTRTEEIVSIKSNEDLQALVQHILKFSRNKSMRDRIAKGDYVFVLENTTDQPSTGKTNTIKAPSPQNRNGVVQIEKGFLSERQIEALPAGTRVVQLGQGVRFTPLARDRLRQRKITVERIK